ncbi:uncharacterized mitochondrial protein-like protein [Tanacetum coccineum]
MRWWRWGGERDGDDDGGGFGGLRLLERGVRDLKGGRWGRWVGRAGKWRVVRGVGSGDRVHRVVGSLFGLAGKIPPENFSGGGSRWPVVGESPEKMSGEGECFGESAPMKLIIELADRTIKRSKGIAENMLVGIDKFVFPIYFIILDMPEDIEVPLILGRPFLYTTHAKMDVFKRRIALRVGNDKIMFKSDNPTSNIIKKVYVLGLRERMELDLEARLMREALFLNSLLDPKYGDYIELNDLNKRWELMRNQEVDDLGPTFEEGEVIDRPMIDIIKTWDDDEMIEGIDEYLSFCNFDRKIPIDCAYNL